MVYKVIIRDPDEGTEKYVESLTKEQAIEKAREQASDVSKQVYVAWVDEDGKEGYLNRDDGIVCDCPGEPW